MDDGGVVGHRTGRAGPTGTTRLARFNLRAWPTLLARRAAITMLAVHRCGALLTRQAGFDLWTNPRNRAGLDLWTCEVGIRRGLILTFFLPSFLLPFLLVFFVFSFLLFFLSQGGIDCLSQVFVFLLLLLSFPNGG